MRSLQSLQLGKSVTEWLYQLFKDQLSWICTRTREKFEDLLLKPHHQRYVFHLQGCLDSNSSTNNKFSYSLFSACWKIQNLWTNFHSVSASIISTNVSCGKPVSTKTKLWNPGCVTITVLGIFCMENSFLFL